MAVADSGGGQQMQVVVLLVVLLAFGVAFYLYDRAHPTPIRRPGRPPAPALDPELPRRPRPYVPPQAPRNDAVLFPAGVVLESVAPPAAPASPDDLGLLLPPLTAEV